MLPVVVFRSRYDFGISEYCGKLLLNWGLYRCPFKNITHYFILKKCMFIGPHSLLLSIQMITGPLIYLCPKVKRVHRSDFSLSTFMLMNLKLLFNIWNKVTSDLWLYFDRRKLIHHVIKVSNFYITFNFLGLD